MANQTNNNDTESGPARLSPSSQTRGTTAKNHLLSTPSAPLSSSAPPSSSASSSSSFVSPTPLKKSKRQAERSARGAFAATKRKEEEDEKFYHTKQPKKPKQTKRRSSKLVSDDASNTTPDGEDSVEGSQAVTPSPTQSPFSKSQSKTKQSTTIPAKKRSSKVSSSSEQRSRGKGTLEKDKTPSNHLTHSSRKRRKLVYRATCDPKRPIYGYALDLVSLVCNNAYCVLKNGNSSHQINSNKSVPTSESPKEYNNKTTTERNVRHQPHRVLDHPSGYTLESEPIKERLMRLMLRQRFASATSMGMSPIEFARKLLKLWGGTLEQVYESSKAAAKSAATAKSNNTTNAESNAKISANANAKTNTNMNANMNANATENTSMPSVTTMMRVVSSEKNNNCSSLAGNKQTEEFKQASRMPFEEENPIMSDGFKTAVESCRFDKAIGDLEPRSIYPGAKMGERKTNGNDLLPGNLRAGCKIYDLKHPHDTGTDFESNDNLPSIFNANDIFGESSNDRIERTKKLKERRHRKLLKKAEALSVASSSLTADPQASTSDSVPIDGKDREVAMVAKTPSSSQSSLKRKPKRTPRKFIEDPSLPVLFKDMRLSHPEDAENLNALHCFVRDKLLEVYVLECKSEDVGGEHDEKTSDKEPQNIVGFRCSQCGHLPRDERGRGQTMSTFFPKSIGEIYRGVCTWQRIHFSGCQHMPEHYKREYKIRKEQDLTRGRKAHWIKSAYDLGLRNIDSERSGLTYRPGSPFDLDEVLRRETDPGGRRTSKPRKATPRKSSSKDHNNLKSNTSPVFAGDEFELFGTDFDRSLEESVEAAATKNDETAF